MTFFHKKLQVDIANGLDSALHLFSLSIERTLSLSEISMNNNNVPLLTVAC